MEQDSSAALMAHYLYSTGQFRREALVSDGELRLEVAKAVVRTVRGDESVLLRGSRRATFYESLQMSSGNRHHVVHGHYTRSSSESDIIMLKGGNYTEIVAGGANQNASVEGEVIAGGAYSANYVGPFFRMAAFCDFLAWGGWGEADATRVELSVMAIRAYMGYAHVTGTKTLMSMMMYDDFVCRQETYGTFVDQTVDSTALGGPGGIVVNET
ncbi:MAG: hypothetical protein OXC62_12180 [Aestuariivita sp.]|nr:hypothetical protein [Aestuariivita sp.]